MRSASTTTQICRLCWHTYNPRSHSNPTKVPASMFAHRFRVNPVFQIFPPLEAEQFVLTHITAGGLESRRTATQHTMSTREFCVALTRANRLILCLCADGMCSKMFTKGRLAGKLCHSHNLCAPIIPKHSRCFLGVAVRAVHLAHISQQLMLNDLQALRVVSFFLFLMRVCARDGSVLNFITANCANVVGCCCRFSRRRQRESIKIGFTATARWNPREQDRASDPLAKFAAPSSKSAPPECQRCTQWPRARTPRVCWVAGNCLCHDSHQTNIHSTNIACTYIHIHTVLHVLIRYHSWPAQCYAKCNSERGIILQTRCRRRRRLLLSMHNGSSVQ